MVSQFYQSFLEPLPKVSFFSPCYTHFINKLKKHKPYSIPFLYPVKKKDAPGYYDIIKNPIDLSTIQKNTENNLYQNKMELIEDIKLMRDNCQMYNISGTIVEYGNEMLRYAEEIIFKEDDEKKIKQRDKPAQWVNVADQDSLDENFASFEAEDVIEKIIEPLEPTVHDKMNISGNQFLARLLLQKWICAYLRGSRFKSVKKEALLILEQVIIWYIKRKIEKE